MTALAANKDVQELASGFSQRVGNYGSGTPDDGKVFYRGALVCYDTNDDTLKPGATSTTLVALGRCEEDFTAGASGAPSAVNVRSGIFKFENSADADAIANDDAGKTCYVVDDQTVALTDGTASRSIAGTVYKVDSDGVWVAIDPFSNAAAMTALIARVVALEGA